MYWLKVCVTALQTPFICMAFTLNMLLFRSFLIVQPIFSWLRRWWTACSKIQTFRNHLTQLYASLTQIHNLKCLSYVKLSSYYIFQLKSLYFYQKQRKTVLINIFMRQLVALSCLTTFGVLGQTVSSTMFKLPCIVQSLSPTMCKLPCIWGFLSCRWFSIIYTALCVL